ncbi:hypothetical protein Dda_4406 [Drechslerella dactyloides]|uniref:Uncharacterized protein n=1 Tax=Drechslerella dactyloides TaxID=74499 RepID=A0AAD6NKK0_DREDA|nr:hypothetical protein Dda_4406 [Drechslerella dactyloides]
MQEYLNRLGKSTWAGKFGARKLESKAKIGLRTPLMRRPGQEIVTRKNSAGQASAGVDEMVAGAEQQPSTGLLGQVEKGSELLQLRAAVNHLEEAIIEGTGEGPAGVRGVVRARADWLGEVT